MTEQPECNPDKRLNYNAFSCGFCNKRHYHSELGLRHEGYRW